MSWSMCWNCWCITLVKARIRLDIFLVFLKWFIIPRSLLLIADTKSHIWPAVTLPFREPAWTITKRRWVPVYSRPSLKNTCPALAWLTNSSCNKQVKDIVKNSNCNQFNKPERQHLELQSGWVMKPSAPCKGSIPQATRCYCRQFRVNTWAPTVSKVWNNQVLSLFCVQSSPWHDQGFLDLPLAQYQRLSPSPACHTKTTR